MRYEQRSGVFGTVLLVIFCCASSAVWAVTTTLAVTGGTVPGGDGQFDIMAEPTLNASGYAAFLALLKNTTGGANDDVGILYYDGSSLTFRARENQGPPEGNGLFSFPGYPTLNGSGHVLFPAELKNTSGGTSDDYGVYSYNGVALLKRMRENDPVPEGNGQFAAVTVPP